MRLVFCGTPEFAVPPLQALLDRGHEIALVLTQPDRPAGRKMEMHEPPVKRVARASGLRVLQPEKIKTNAEMRTELESVRPDAIVVVAYGRILPGWMLELPPLGNLNLHGSLLPKYRGAAPIQWAVANGETETGVTTMRLDAGLDTGDVLLERRVPVGPETTAAELYPQLAEIGAGLMVETIDGLERGTITARPQDHSRATLAPILTREDGRMDLEHRAAQTVYNRWRGFAPWPGAWANFRGKRFLVHRMRLAEDGPRLHPGELVLSADELYVGGAQDTRLVLDEVQMEGKPRLPGAVFARDFQLKPGDSLA
jgi:methionyl-tRNA formyltransferase